MNSKSTFKTVILAAVAALSAIGAVFFYLGISGEFEASLGYFVNNSSMAPIIYAILISGPVLGLVFSVSRRGTLSKNRSLPGNGKLPMRILSAVLGLCIAVSAVLDFMSSMNGAPKEFASVIYISWVLAALSFICLIRSAIVRENEASPLTCTVSFILPLFYASKVLVTYFDRTVAVNSPIQIICQLAFISFMLTLTAETGIMLGRKKIYRRYLFTLCSSAVICSVFGLGSVICCVAGVDFFITWDTGAVMCASAAYAFLRLIFLSGYETETAVADDVTAEPDAAEQAVGDADENSESGEDSKEEV